MQKKYANKHVRFATKHKIFVIDEYHNSKKARIYLSKSDFFTAKYF